MSYRMLQWFLNLLSYTPLRVMYVLSDLMFYPLYYIVRYRRKVVRRNLTESFPEKSLPEIRKLEKRFYRFFADTIFETCKMATISRKEIGRRMKFTNREDIEAVLGAGRSVSLYLGHYGNWEWVSSMPLYLGREIVAGQIYHRLSNKAVDRLLIRNRERMGAICIEMRETARRVSEFANGGKVSIIGYIADQKPKKRYIRHYVQFLHHRTPVLVGAEKITKRYGFEAWYLDIVRIRRGYYEARFVRLCENPRPLPDFALTDMYYSHLEQAIVRQPELYLWTHNRFKHAKKSDK